MQRSVAPPLAAVPEGAEVPGTAVGRREDACVSKLNCFMGNKT